MNILEKPLITIKRLPNLGRGKKKTVNQNRSLSGRWILITGQIGYVKWVLLDKERHFRRKMSRSILKSEKNADLEQQKSMMSMIETTKNEHWLYITDEETQNVDFFLIISAPATGKTQSSFYLHILPTLHSSSKLDIVPLPVKSGPLSDQSLQDSLV